MRPSPQGRNSAQGIPAPPVTSIAGMATRFYITGKLLVTIVVAGSTGYCVLWFPSGSLAVALCGKSTLCLCELLGGYLHACCWEGSLVVPPREARDFLQSVTQHDIRCRSRSFSWKSHLTWLSLQKGYQSNGEFLSLLETTNTSLRATRVQVYSAARHGRPAVHVIQAAGLLPRPFSQVFLQGSGFFWHMHERLGTTLYIYI